MCLQLIIGEINIIYLAILNTNINMRCSVNKINSKFIVLFYIYT